MKKPQGFATLHDPPRRANVNIRRSGTRRIAVEPAAMPALRCPYPSQSSPHQRWVEQRNVEWLERVGLVRGAAVARLRRSMFGLLAARAYPTATREGLAVAAAWASWLFLRDDVCDEGSDRVAEMRRQNAIQIDVLSGASRPADGDPFAHALVDLRERMIALGGTAWMSRFLGNVQDYFDACIWEASNRARSAAPDLETYVYMRDLTGAVRTCFDIYELVGAGPLPVEVRNAPVVRSIMTLGNRMICWSNDIFSADKERAHGDFHNLVLILQRSGATRDEAISEAVRMHDGLVDELATEEARLARSPALMRAAAPVVEATKGWVRANLDWSLETGRYVAAS